MKIDIVYILGRGSLWKNNELLYSLRSVEKHLKNYRNVYIVGFKPSFLGSEVIEMPNRDIYTNKQRNIMAKIYHACIDSRISDNFIFFNDDHFLLQDCDASEYPNYYEGDLLTYKTYNSYEKSVKETIKVLEIDKKPTFHFDIHRPIIYNKVKFRKMADYYNWNTQFGYLIKSLYCNHFNKIGIPAEDNKINYPHKLGMIEQINRNKAIFSIGDKAVNSEMKYYLNQLFPNKSKFEL